MDKATLKGGKGYSYQRLMNTTASEFPADAVAALQEFRRWMRDRTRDLLILITPVIQLS